MAALQNSNLQQRALPKSLSATPTALVSTTNPSDPRPQHTPLITKSTPTSSPQPKLLQQPEPEPHPKAPLTTKFTPTLSPQPKLLQQPEPEPQPKAQSDDSISSCGTSFFDDDEKQLTPFFLQPSSPNADSVFSFDSIEIIE
jgi:hypothetical protein